MAFFTPSQLNSPPSPPPPSLLHSSFRNREFKLWKKRHRLKKNKPKFLPPLQNNLEPPSSSSSSLDFLNLLPLNWLPPAALGLASALVIRNNNNKTSNSTNNKKLNTKFNNNTPTDKNDVVGEWILFTSPTPFNRFVLLRCPSVSFQGAGVSEKLVEEDRHYVRLDSGKIHDNDDVEERGSGNDDVEYQRVCVGTEDGGVISLDWPAELDISEERGFDTTVLMIPGTAKGSNEESVVEFVRECLRRGLFPVVMNPRGCAGSPLTTARLFTAADSDDICSAIQFITRARPWSTLTGVGWGYGANMLTKYLAEAGEKTPLTAATCIDNPFDLDEATRTTPYCTAMDNKLTGGLIDILKSNKELFQGRRKGFDVEKALAAETVRDFEESISMVSYGFDSIEDFYSNSSTRLLMRNLKIPVLFVQNDNGTVPLFSIPRGAIAENPFTSLLLCSCLPSNGIAISWYQQVAIEWLTAVELGLLKGRHPLLEDIDVAINPSKGLALVEGRTSDTNSRLDSVLNLAKVDSSDAYMDPMKEMLAETDAIDRIPVKLNQNSLGSQPPHYGVVSETNGAFPHNSKDEVSDTETSSEDSDSGQVLQTAQAVMSMLDVTMPGTLKEEEKKKVLSAVGQGETLVKALEGAVPEDVRGKLTTSVSEILQTQGKNLNFNKLLSINHKDNASSSLNAKSKESFDTKNENIDQPSNERASGDVDKPGGEAIGAQPPKTPVRSDIPESKAVDSHDDDTGLNKDLSNSQNTNEKLDSDSSAKKVGQPSESAEDGFETTAKINSSSHSTGDANSEAGVTQSDTSQNDERNQKESDISGSVGEPRGLSDEKNDTSSTADNRPADTNEATASPISESQPSEKGDDESKTEGEVVPSLSGQSRASDSKSPSFDVSQALDALTGMDDSTQVAVNSVFGVLEGMIAQLEENQNESVDNKVIEDKKALNGSVVEKDSSELQLEKQTNGEDMENVIPLDLESVSLHDSNRSMRNSPTAAASKEKDTEKFNLIVNKLPEANADGMANIGKNSFYITSDPHVKALYKEFLRKYLLSDMQKEKHVDIDSTTMPFLHNVPKDGHWLLLKQPDGIHVAIYSNREGRKDDSKVLRKENVMDNVIEPSYVIVNKERQEIPAEELKDELRDKSVNHDSKLDRSKFLVKTTLLNSLKVEVSRKLNATDVKDMEAVLAADMEGVADAVYLAIQHDGEHSQKLLFSGLEPDFQEWSKLNGNRIVEVISEAVQNTSYLKTLLPIGVIVGSTLAALRKCADFAAVYCTSAAGALDTDLDDTKVLKPEDRLAQVIQLRADGTDHDLTLENDLRKVEVSVGSNASDELDGEKAKPQSLGRDTLMVGAVTAALGASALLTSQQDGFMGNDSCETSEDKHTESESVKLQETADNNNQSNIVTSLAEKAMSVAAPVVPTKEDGAVDQERIVSMLTELGQRGGMLRLVGKLALLWGGLRGAMSLTDRLISFLRIADRPLMQRVLGFSCMVLVLWSPVVVPLLPTLLHNMATHTSSRIVELACVVGLYGAVTILIIQWGKRIRGYENPLKQYGLDLMSSRKVQHFLIGLVGGIMLVVSIHSLNSLLGFVHFSFPSNLGSSPLNLIAKVKAHGHLFVLAGQGLLMAAGVSFVEELLFRSWLLEEIAADFGYYPGILLSGLAFSISQRSWQTIPGLWLLSICLAGARLRKEGSLFIPIGLRTGLMASSYMLQTGGFLVYQPKFPWWVVGAHPFQPFNGVIGFLTALLLAVVLYPRQPELRERVPRSIRA